MFFATVKRLTRRSTGSADGEEAQGGARRRKIKKLTQKS